MDVLMSLRLLKCISRKAFEIEVETGTAQAGKARSITGIGCSPRQCLGNETSQLGIGSGLKSTSSFDLPEFC